MLFFSDKMSGNIFMGAVIKAEKNKQQVKEEKSYSIRNSKAFSFTFIVQLKRNADRLHYYKPALLYNFSPCVKKTIAIQKYYT